LSGWRAPVVVCCGGREASLCFCVLRFARTRCGCDAAFVYSVLFVNSVLLGVNTLATYMTM
jgi:hypothetical protein